MPNAHDHGISQGIWNEKGKGKKNSFEAGKIAGKWRLGSGFSDRLPEN